MMVNHHDKLQSVLETKYADCTNEEPALHRTVIRSDFETLKLFIRCGTDIDMVDKFGKLPIAYVKEKSQLNILGVLLALESNIYKLDKFGKMQFSAAFRSGHTDVVKKYLKNKINLNVADSKGQTAIHYLMIRRYEYGLWCTLSNLNFNTNVKDLSGQTPLLLAIKYKKLTWIKLLLEKGANVNDAFEQQSTWLYTLFRSLCDDEIISEEEDRVEFRILDLLLEKTIEVNKILYGSYTALKLAIEYFNLGTIKPLLKKLAIIEKSGSTIIDINRETIEQYTKVKSSYSTFKAELEKMKEFELRSKVSYFDILVEEDIDTLVKYFENKKLRRNFNKNFKKLSYYNSFLERKLSISMQYIDRKNEISKTEKVLSEIFHYYFPPHIIRKIAVYSFPDTIVPNFQYYII